MRFKIIIILIFANFTVIYIANGSDIPSGFDINVEIFDYKEGTQIDSLQFPFKGTATGMYFFSEKNTIGFHDMRDIWVKTYSFDFNSFNSSLEEIKYLKSVDSTKFVNMSLLKEKSNSLKEQGLTSTLLYSGDTQFLITLPSLENIHISILDNISLNFEKFNFYGEKPEIKEFNISYSDLFIIPDKLTEKNVSLVYRFIEIKNQRLNIQFEFDNENSYREAWFLSMNINNFTDKYAQRFYTNSNLLLNEPTFSLDGSKILTSAYSDGISVIYLGDLRTGTLTSIQTKILKRIWPLSFVDNELFYYVYPNQNYIINLDTESVKNYTDTDCCLNYLGDIGQIVKIGFEKYIVVMNTSWVFETNDNLTAFPLIMEGFIVLYVVKKKIKKY